MAVNGYLCCPSSEDRLRVRKKVTDSMAEKDTIFIKGARVNNLKNIDVEIPRNKFVVITGLSGSGKSSLAFDTLYAEGQRRYVESLSAYARQFLGRMSKPECDYIKGLPPAIAIEQRVNTRNPRSTVAPPRRSMNTFACSTHASARRSRLAPARRSRNIKSMMWSRR